ncbi:hypothetical protein DMN50_31675 [Priestia megaterium]|nr:hypothetical protein DMN50_31675 [Priestia megaterium]
MLSIKLYAVPNGLSLRNLINYARQEVKTDIKLLLKLEKEVARTKMVDPNETGPIFDEVYARENMKWCWIEDVPKFYCIYPKGVSNCYYDSDLSYANDINDKELNKWLDTW